MTSPVLISLASSPFVAIVGQELEDHEDEGQEPEYREGVAAASLSRAAGLTGLRRQKMLDQVTLRQGSGQTEISGPQPVLSLMGKIVTDADILHLNNFSFHWTVSSSASRLRTELTVTFSLLPGHFSSPSLML